MANINFNVEGHQYTLPEDFKNLEHFTVQSSPKAYEVMWDINPHPYEAICSLLEANTRNVLLIDKNVYDLYLKDLNIDTSRVYFIEATESAKTMDSVMSVVGFLDERKFTKGETFIVVGGGIVQDIGAFVGACFKRGISWVYFPTTLLSMCDSCIGGKTGINHHHVKNQMALFSAPSQVMINLNFLKTLRDEDIKSGLGEILKLSITGGNACFAMYKDKVHQGKVSRLEDLKPLILGSLWVKKAVIEHDEFELNYRRCLNYGHTVGHAIEVLTDYKIPHGQAVALGIVVVNQLSVNRHRLSEATHLDIKIRI